MNSEKLLLLFFVVFGNIVMAQTKPATASKLGGGSARVPPAIKCVDPDSAVACKSFKQLIDARDSGVLFGVSVSYTHLDVYKRQSEYWATRRMRGDILGTSVLAVD